MAEAATKTGTTLGTSYLSRRIDKMFSQRDSDGNGTLSQAEFTAQLGNAQAAGQNLTGAAALTAASRLDQFKAMDKDSDGQLTKDEMKAYEQQKLNALRASLLQMQELLTSNDTTRQASGKHHTKHHNQNAAGSTAISSSNVETLLKKLGGDAQAEQNSEDLSYFVQQLAPTALGTSAAR